LTPKHVVPPPRRTCPRCGQGRQRLLRRCPRCGARYLGNRPPGAVH